MLTYTTYSEAGGVGKTTLAANLSEAHARAGRDVLTIDLDPQQGSLTYLLGVDAPRHDPDADNLVQHLIGNPQGAFGDLIHETPYGFDVIPSHDMLEDLGDWLDEAQDRDLIEYPTDQLRQVLLESDVVDEYDTIVIDPPATAGPQLSNAIAATRSLVVPFEATGKGRQSIEGLAGLVSNLERQLSDRLEQQIDIGVLAVVPNRSGRTNAQARHTDRTRELGYTVPVVIGQRESLLEGCWDEQCTAYHYVDEHRSRKRDHEQETLEKIDELAATIASEGEQ